MRLQLISSSTRSLFDRAGRTLLLVAVVLLCCLAASGNSQTTISVPLKWSDSLVGTYRQVDPVEAALKKEPTYAGDVVRGLLKIEASPASWVAFALDSKAKRVYVDLNRDLDLTNDPSGQIAFGGSTAALDVPLTTATASPRTRVEFLLRGPTMVRTNGGWTGDFDLNGKRWAVEVTDSTIIFPSKSKNALRRGLAGVRGQWILDGCGLSGEVAELPDPATTSVRMLQLTTHETSKGTVLLSGTDVQEILLTETTPDQPRASSRVVMIDRPTTAIQMPVGDYRLDSVLLTSGLSANIYKPVSVKPGTTATLVVGGPVKGGAKVRTSSDRLLLDYSLTGIGGESYGVSNRSSPTRFAIYKGQRKIAAGAFEYG